MTEDLVTGKILMVAYYYPPIAAAGSHRSMNFSRELAKLGWDVSVISCSNYKRNNIDLDLMDRIGPGIRIKRAPCTDPVRMMAQWKLNIKNWFKTGTVNGDKGGNGSSAAVANESTGFLDWLSRLMKTPDSMLTFIPGAVMKAIPMIMSSSPDVIYSSAPPYSCHLTSFILKNLFKIPWVADFRDPWADNPFRRNSPYPSLLGLNKNLEKIVLNEADLIVTNTTALEAAFRKRYPNLDHFVTINNGFDPALVEKLEASGKRGALKKSSKIRIIHTGEVYGLRSPDSLIEALGELKKESNDAYSSIELEFIGNVHEKERLSSLADSLEVGSSIIYKDQVGHKEALDSCQDADILLLLGVAGSEPEIQAPSKLFEYLVLKKPIISLSKKGGAIHNLLDESSIPYLLADLEKKEEIKTVLKRLFDDDFDGGDSWDNVKSFSFERLTLRLAKLLGNIKKGTLPNHQE